MLKNSRNRKILAETVEMADTPLRRLKGLLGRTYLQPSHVLILDETNSIHMWFMLFAIDVIFLDSERKVLKVFPNRLPFGIPVLAWGAHYAVELPVGVIEASETVPGDELSW